MEAKEVKAKLSNIRMTARKMRLVANLIRGRNTSEAIIVLNHCPKRAAISILQLLNSAISNATNNHQLNGDQLVIKTIIVNEGPTLKRIRPRAKGRAYQVLKRSSHVEMILIDKSEKRSK